MITIETGDRRIVDLTPEVRAFCAGRGDGLLSVFAPHATAGVAESVFRGTTLDGRLIEAVGAEVMEFVDGRISVIRDYHRMRDAG